MDAPSLFDVLTEPRARRTDPTTSHAAAKSVRNQTETHDRVLELLETFGDATDEDLFTYWRQMRDLHDWPAISPSGLRSRRSELVELGLVVDTGRRGTTASGRACIIWDIAAGDV